MYIRDWFIRWLFEYGDRKKYKGLPRGCWNCEVLGLCRRPKEEGWKCYDGCMLRNMSEHYVLKGDKGYFIRQRAGIIFTTMNRESEQIKRFQTELEAINYLEKYEWKLSQLSFGVECIKNGGN